jgi:hypothetical protein
MGQRWVAHARGSNRLQNGGGGDGAMNIYIYVYMYIDESIIYYIRTQYAYKICTNPSYIMHPPYFENIVSLQIHRVPFFFFFTTFTAFPSSRKMKTKTDNLPPPCRIIYDIIYYITAISPRTIILLFIKCKIYATNMRFTCHPCMSRLRSTVLSHMTASPAWKSLSL